MARTTEIEINEQIRDREVRVIGPDGEQLGIMSSKDAYMMARNQDLDLIKIAATATPPVVKIADFGKYRYEMLRKEKGSQEKSAYDRAERDSYDAKHRHKRSQYQAFCCTEVPGKGK